MEINPDPDCLPADKQFIQFQISVEELYGKWRNGYYNAIEQAVYEQVNDDVNGESVIIHCIMADVVRWLPGDENQPVHWRNITAGELELVAAWSRLHNKKKTPN
ncbi:hypothetical protein [Pedobacter cryoconitis]|uniref:Uncharacterized protein n=1 Tax=Pedobacter cryoconitis TaxID=188932 RepID=A0A327SMX6_9SPHI|nr:hypothetical protein [Pedobacter cryoconitis]RAJ28883.1 hypothetical protein LY11_03157 [Pedobacter cryoconitis]